MKTKPLKSRVWKSVEDLYQHCQRVIQDKESYAKSIIQEAQQIIDEKLSTNTIKNIQLCS